MIRRIQVGSVRQLLWWHLLGHGRLARLLQDRVLQQALSRHRPLQLPQSPLWQKLRMALRRIEEITQDGQPEWPPLATNPCHLRPKWAASFGSPCHRTSRAPIFQKWPPMVVCQQYQTSHPHLAAARHQPIQRLPLRDLGLTYHLGPHSQQSGRALGASFGGWEFFASVH